MGTGGKKGYYFNCLQEQIRRKKEDLYLYVCVYVMKDDDGNVLNDPMKAKVDSICQ